MHKEEAEGGGSSWFRETLQLVAFVKRINDSHSFIWNATLTPILNTNIHTYRYICSSLLLSFKYKSTHLKEKTDSQMPCCSTPGTTHYLLYISYPVLHIHAPAHLQKVSLYKSWFFIYLFYQPTYLFFLSDIFLF